MINHRFIIYKKVNIICNEEEFRQTRIINIIDELYNMIPIDYIVMIKSLEDIKGTLNVYWSDTPSLFYKEIINSLWMEQNEDIIKHIFK